MSSANSEIFDAHHPLLQKHEGLTMSEAFENLYSEILQFRNGICNKRRNGDFCRRIFFSTFHHSSYYSTFSWIPISIVAFIVTALSIFAKSSYYAILIIFLTFLDIFVVYWYNYLRLSEFRHRLSYILEMLKKTRKNNDWCPGQYPNLFTPNSPAVSLQWTIRDGRILNLPTSLLAKGDVIILRPGQLAPAHVKTCYPAPSLNDKYDTLLADQLFGQEPTANAGELIHFDAQRSANQPLMNDRLYTVLQAPYIAQLNALSEDYFERPVSLYDKARYLLFGKSLHHTILPLFFIIFELLALVRWYFSSFPPQKNFVEDDRWTYFFILETSSLIIPLISPVFPIFWFISNAFGNAFLLSRYSFSRNEMSDQSGENDAKFQSSGFNDIESSLKSSISHTETKQRQRSHLFRLLSNFIQNHMSAMTRYTNFLHTMASVTELCCVDKKGVLSFPNPIAEKVFFLKNSCHSPNPRNGEIAWDGSHVAVSSTEDSKVAENLHKLAEECPTDKSSKRISPSVEILDITPRDEKGSAWKIEFDDCQWQCHLTSLKALGLAILVNTCNKRTHETYNNFYSFITAHAVQYKHLVPVANRRCLCELARQIGFHEKYIENKYGLELQIFTYKNLTETQTGNKYVKAIFKTRKPKFPFPHAMSVIVNNDNLRNSNYQFCHSKIENFDDSKKRKQSIHTCEERQMFSQGTADIILDFCVDYWDGKRILDFYQRCSLTAYCTAFSYRPVHKNLCKTNNYNSNSVMYLEYLNHINSERGYLRQNKRYRKTQEFRKCNRDSSLFGNLPDFKSHHKNERETIPLQKLPECDENMDESFDDNIEDYDENISYSTTDCNDEFQFENYSEESNEDDENYSGIKLNYGNEFTFNGKIRPELINHEMQSRYVQILNKQIFLGMVSMQYQPLVDMVQLIEELEKACIRFVHFSKENELRSRVFSEKMGLESGWNCHISLLPDADSKSLAENFGNEGISILGDTEMNSMVDTGASSADDEENIPFSFDLSNRAKLPCGIMNIRPHLEQVDNVPLLVSLFTDCTSETTEQMLSIMQEYGQIVCVLGSSANIKNFILFARADSSISVEPLYAQVCQQIPSSLTNEKGQKSCLSPTELSHILNSLPCSLILQRNYNYHRILPVYPLIAESRNLMRSVWNCVQFWLCCITFTFAVQLLPVLSLLPAIFTLDQALWISIIVIPCLSISLITSPHDEDIMTKAKGKDWLCSISWPTIQYALTCYGSKLICGVLAVYVSFYIELRYICDCSNTINSDPASFFNSTLEHIVQKKNCNYLYFLNSSENDFLEAPHLHSLNAVQFHMALILTLNLVALCTSFLHRDSVFWRKLPKFNLVWILLVFIPLFLQVCHYIYTINNLSSECLLSNISLWSAQNAFFTFLSPCLSYIISEIIKIHEIRINERYQKKVRLEFGTKLGMNSPF